MKSRRNAAIGGYSGASFWPAPAELLVTSTAGMDDPLLISKFADQNQGDALYCGKSIDCTALGQSVEVIEFEWLMLTRVPKTRCGARSAVLERPQSGSSRA